MIYFVACICLVLITMNCGCHNLKKYKKVSGLDPQLDSDDIQKYKENQDEVLKELVQLANLSSEPIDGSENWGKIVDAGLNYVDQKCEDYLDAIFWFDRHRKTTSNQINLIGTATI